MFFANGAVKADALPVSPVTANTEKVNAGVTGLTEGVPPKENLIEKSKEVESDKTTVAQKPVDKSPLVQAISELQAAIAKVDEESLLSLSNQLSQLTDENKRLLDGENISEEALANQVNRVQSFTEQVRQLKSKSKTEDKTSNKEDRADSKAQNTKELKVFDKAVNPTNQAEEIKAVQKDKNKGEDTANKDKLEALSKSLITYLDTAKKIERPDTKKLLEGVEEIVRSVENGLANPKLTTSEIEELMKRGKQAEKKLALAVTREHSGKRDSLNGNKMLPESYFRAPNTREGANTEFGNAYTAWMITNDDVRRFQSAGINDPNYHGYNYPVGTFLYNSNNAENSPINNNNMQGPQRIAWTRNRVYVQVNRVSGNEQSGYDFNWKIQFNAGREPHQKPFYYFTLPDGHDFSSSVVLKENESQIATGTIDDVLQKSQGLLNGKMGTTEGVNGGEYYKGTGLINGRPYIQAPIRTLEDFVKNSTNYYFNRSGVNGDIIQKSDFLFENIRNSTKNIIAIQPQGRNPGGFNHSYSFEFTTHSNSGDAPYYVAGVKTYETTLGLTQHRSYSQWGTLKDAYTIKTDSFTNGDFKKKTFLKGTQLGAFENSSYSFNSDAVSTVMGDRFIDAGLVLRNNTTGQDERPRKGGLLLKITPTATIDGSKYSHIHNFYNYNNPNDALTNSKDRTKGGHLAYLEGTYNGSTIKIPFSFNIVTQSDIFEPVKNETKENQARKTTESLGNASDFISGYKNVSSRIPDLFTNWNEGNTDTLRRIFKGGSDRFPGSSDDIKNRAIKNVEWADGNSNLTGEKIVPVKVRYTPQGAAAYEETKYVTLPPELNNLSIGQVLTDSQKQKIIELAKTTFDADSASFDTNAAKVGVKKQVKITYMDNEKNALTGNKDDSVRYVDFHFTNLTVPDSNKPVVTMNGRTLTTNADENRFIIYRGAAFNPTFNVTDESRIGSLMVRNLPKGVYFNKVDNVDKERVGTTTTLNHTISGDDSNKVSDDATRSVDKGNQATLKFKVKTYDLAFEDRGTRVDDNTRSDVLGLNTQSLDPNHYLAITDGRNVTNDWGSGMVFRYLKENNEIRERVSFDKIGKHSVKARAYFPNSKTSTKGLPTNPTTGLTGDTASVAGRGYLEKTVEFNVKPNTPTISQPQFYGTASSKPTVTVENLPTNAQLQNGATVTVELYQGTTKVASKTVTDRNGTTTLSAENFTANLTEGQQVHAVVKVSGGQGATAYSVNSDNSENRNVTGRSTLSNLATDKLVVQVQDFMNNRRGTLSEAEKNTIKQAIFEANKNGVLRGKQVSDITISDTGLITALDKDNKIAELQINPRNNVVTRFAHIRDDYNITFTNNGKPANRSTDPGFEWSQDRKSLIYKFDATSGVALQTNEVLKTITATPKNSQGQPSLTTVTGNDKALGEANSNGFSRNTSTGYFSKNGVGVNVLDLVNPTSYGGGGNVDNTTNKLVENNRTDINNRNIVGTTLGNDNISAANSANVIPLTNVVKGQNSSSLVVRKQLYLMPKYTTNELLADRGTTNANNTNVINVYFVPVDPTAPRVERSTSNTLATTSAQANRLADNTSFASLAKLTDNYDKDDVTNPSSNTVRNKLNMWVKKGDTKVQIVENGVEKTAVINSLKKEIDPATYEVIAKTSDASGNQSHADNSDGESLGFFRVGYNLVARQTINVVRGETLTQAELNKLVQVQEGNTLQDLPQGATVTATLDTNSIRSGSEETKTVEATVNFGENRTKKVRLTYKVLNTFPIANTIYDFKDVPRSNGHSDYYSNTGNNIPGGMNWLYKRSGGAEQSGTSFTRTLASDPVGTTVYTFIGRYDYGRHTNRPTSTGNLEHSATLEHKVFDIADSKNVSVSQGTTLSAEQAKAAVKNATGSDTLPNGTRYEWVGNKVASTSGKQTFQVKVTLPVSQTGDNLPAATQATPSKTIDVTVSVTPPKPTFDSNKVTSTSRTITGTLGGLNANSSNTVVSVALNDGTNRILTSENNGGVRINGNMWTATLPDDVKLRTSVAKNGETTQPRGLTVTTKIKGSTTADDISVTSDVKAVEMGDYSVNATIAGSKHIDVKVPHDAKRMELRFHNSTETSNTPKSIVLVRGADGTWHTDATRANNTAVANANGYVGRISSTVSTTNPAENNIRIELNEQSGSTKLHIKEESANGDNTESYGSGLGLRVYNQPEAGQEPSATGKWKVANVTNNKPTLSYKGPEASSETARKVFPSGTSITKAMLENLVTVGDTEDKATNETDKPYGTSTVKIVSGLTETPGKATASGSYAVVLKAVDSQGKESDPLTVYVGVVSTVLKYQPKVGGVAKGEAKDITVPAGKTHQGDSVSYTPEEITVDGKVYKPETTGEQTVTLTDKPQTVDVTYVEKPATSTPTFTVGTQNPQTGNVEVTVDGVPEGTKVKLPGIASEKVVTGGKVELTHNELPENPTTGKGIAQEDGKLPKEGTSDITIPGKLTSAKGEPAREFEVTIPLPIVVPDPEHLTPKEIEKLVDKVKESNPNTIVTADDKGNVTVTDKTTGDSVLIPVKDLTVKDFELVKPTDKVPVKDKSHLTPEEKKQVADKVKDKNPGKEVTVGDDGTATVTDPTTGISHTIPGTELVNQDFELVKPTDKVPVKDKSHLTPEEKKQVADKVKDKNPGKEVTVGDDGTATVTDPTTGISHTIPGTELVNQDFELVKPTDKVPVKNIAHLTPEEKKQVADKVKDKNPGKEVTVGDDGTATVTDPTTGISHTIPGTELVNQDFEPVIPADKIPVKDPDNLTQEEQDKVKESVEKANPGKKVTVDKTGKVTITDPNTDISHEIPGEKLITLVPPVVDIPEYTSPIGTTGVDENGNLIEPPIKHQTKLIITKWVDEKGNELKPADAKAPKVLGEANEAFEHGEIEGYVFVRTETKGDVVTHVFRKVSQVRPIGNGQQRPATPSDVTNSRPDTAIPAEVPATQPTEQPSQTVEVPTQLPNEVSETDSSVSQPQAVLPNTGTQEDRATGALGVLSLLGAFGLLFAKKKKDDEEEA